MSPHDVRDPGEFYEQSWFIPIKLRTAEGLGSYCVDFSEAARFHKYESFLSSSYWKFFWGYWENWALKYFCEDS